MSPARDARLLILDDEPRILSALRRTLRREPYEVFTAESVPEALRMLDAERIDVVLSDYKMPGTTGLRFLAEVRDRSPRTVRMLITGWTELISEGEIAGVGIQAIITKPWEDSALKETLRVACKSLISRR